MTEQEKTRIFSVVGLVQGTQLNGLFEIDEKIASGGMGEVFRGHEVMSGHPIAIKIVLSELAKDETIVGLFNKEARVLRDFNHPAIVRYMAFGVDPVIGRPYLVMEFIDGPSLAERLESGPLELEEAKNLFWRLASGLDAAHQLGVIHRDISCDNVILAGGSVANAKIIDFGIARTAKGVTLLEGKFAGKYNFVSPEQLGLFESYISEATDIYSFGLLMVNALRGTPIDMNGTQVEIIEKRRSVPDISDIDESMRPIIELMLQPNPALRKVTMADIADWFAPARERSKPPRPIPTAPPAPSVQETPAPTPKAMPELEHSPFLEEPLDIEKSQEAKAEVPESIVADEGKDRGPAALSSDDITGRTAGSVAPPDDALAAGAESYTGQDKTDDVAEPVLAHLAELVAANRSPASDAASESSGADDLPPAPAQTVDEIALDAEKQDDPIPLSNRSMQGKQADPGGMATSHPDRRTAGGGKGKGWMVGLALVIIAGALGGGYWLVQQKGKPVDKQDSVARLTPSPNPVAKKIPADQATVPETPSADDGAKSPEIANPPTPPVLPQAPPEPLHTDVASNKLGAIGEKLAWVREYDGGECFFARSIAAGADDMRIEGMAKNPEDFAIMETKFDSAFGFEPAIEVRPIVERQCGVAKFLSELANDELPTLRMELDSDRLKSGGTVQGVLSGLNKPNTVLYLVDNDGFVYQIDQFLRREGESGRFNIKLVELATRDPLPQMVIALSSDKPIRGAALAKPAMVTNLMPKLLNSIRSENIGIEYAFSYFLLGGS